MSKQKITIFHSPDADDAFMFYGLTSGAVNDPKFDFTHDLCDIESLNHRAIAGEIDVTAVSVHAFAYLQEKFAILTCGASMGGKDYGPRVVARQSTSGESLAQLKRIAVPGKYTSATLALQLFMKENDISAELVPYDFKDVFRAVLEEEVDAGIIIHEGQLTFQEHKLHLMLDLGEWWFNKTQLPLPLGVNVVAKSLGAEAMEASATALYESIVYSLNNRKQALEYAMRYARGISPQNADDFVAMYVNELTLDLGSSGKRSITLFLEAAATAGLIPAMPTLEFIEPVRKVFVTSEPALSCAV